MRISYKAKIVLVTTLITALTSVAIALIYLQRSTQIVENSHMQSIWSAMSVSVNAFDDKAREAYNIAVSLSFDEQLIEKAASYEHNRSDIESALDISAHMKAYCQDDSIVESIYLYLPMRKQIITSVDYRAVQEVFYDFRHEWITNPTQVGSGLAPRLIYDEISRAPKYMLSYVRQLYDQDGELIAIISVNMDERKLFYHCLDTIGAISTGSYYLIDHEGSIVSTESINAIGTSLVHESDAYALTIDNSDTARIIKDEEGTFIASYRSPLTNLRIVCVTDREELIATLNEQTLYIFALLTLLLVAATMVAYHLSRRIYRPIESLKNAMQEASMGDLSARAAVYSRDDIGQLSEGFNEMVLRIEDLIDEVVREQTKKKEAELEALQYQITPHFMYNTLNSIKFAAYLDDNKRIGDLLGAFIELLQTTINVKAPFQTLHEEVQMLQNYVALQLFHFNNSFAVEFDVAQNALQGCIPRLLLQPLVENCIIHGQDGQGKTFHILISVQCMENTLFLRVEDNGKGMSAEQVEALVNGKYAQKGQFSKIGVANVIQRLSLYYGEEASLCYDSQIGEGTKVEIRLPYTCNPNQYRV